MGRTCLDGTFENQLGYQCHETYQEILHLQGTLSNSNFKCFFGYVLQHWNMAGSPSQSCNQTCHLKQSINSTLEQPMRK